MTGVQTCALPIYTLSHFFGQIQADQIQADLVTHMSSYVFCASYLFYLEGRHKGDICTEIHFKLSLGVCSPPHCVHAESINEAISVEKDDHCRSN